MPDCAECPKGETHHASRWRAPQRKTLLSGILNVDKPSGMTSHDVIQALRRVVGQRKIGHAGTLDPMATGVLLVCLGDATRVSEYLMAGRKRYRATVVLGASTDTYDAEGQVVDLGGKTDWSQAEIEAALAPFVGRIDQVPPLYSALKRDGQPLHRLARQGKTVELEPRSVEIDEISILDWSPPALVLEVTCSPGTYIRSLAHDLGQALGCGGYLGSLVRLSSGRFRLEEAVSLERLEEAFEYGEGERYLMPLDEALLDWPAVVVGAEDAQRILHGQAVAVPPAAAGDERRARVYSLEGDFLAIATYDVPTQEWRPKKVFSG